MVDAPTDPVNALRAQQSGHGGTHAIAAAVECGVDVLFTLSGAHVFPLYDAAVGGKDRVESATDRRAAEQGGPVRLVDTRHEQTAVFAAEAMGKLTRRAGFAAVTAGPGVTNGVTAMTGALFNGSPLVVIGGRSPDARWGSGALQELDQPPILRTVTKAAYTIHETGQIGARVADAFALAATPHRGPVFVDIPMDTFFSWADLAWDQLRPRPLAHPTADTDAIAAAATALANAHRPVLVIGSDVWMDDAVEAARSFAEDMDLPTIANGMGRGVLPAAHPLLVTRARAAAFAEADLVLVVGTPLDFRLGYGIFGDPSSPASVIHVTDSPAASPGHPSIAGPIGSTLAEIGRLARSARGTKHDSDWAERLRQSAALARSKDASLLSSDASPIHPARIIGELIPRLTADSIVIGDGGDFVSFAGKYIEPQQPGRWLDPGPYGALGTGPGYAIAAKIAHPTAPVFLLLGDGAAGFSFMDVESLLRHRLPVVIIVGNNAGWALEKHPMRFLYGYDVIADLPATRYDRIAEELGCGGELVTSAADIGPAIDRAMRSGIPYVVNVMTDPDCAYPRSTTGI